MKAILIIDRPKACGECKLNEERPLLNRNVPVCNATGVMVGGDELTSIPNWCPLIPIKDIRDEGVVIESHISD